MSAEQATQQTESLVASMMADRRAAAMTADQVLQSPSAPASAPPEASAGAQVQAEAKEPAPEQPTTEAAPAPEAREEPRVTRLVEANARKDRELRALRQSADQEVERRVQERLNALRGEDPDAELKKLGLSDDDRKTMYRRGWFKHTPNGAPAELRQELAEQGLRGELAQLRSELAQEKQERAHHAATAEAAAIVAQQLGGSAADSIPYLKREYAADPKAATAAFFAVGREMVQAGQLDPQNQPPEDVVKLVGRELDKRIRSLVERTTKVHQPTQHQPANQTAPQKTQTAAPQTPAPTQTLTNKATSTTQPKRQPQTVDELVADMISERAR